MKRTICGSGNLITLWILNALFAINLFASPAVAQSTLTAIQEKQLARIVQQITTSSRGPNAVSFALKELGFPPPEMSNEFLRGTTFRQLPDARKLSAAYHAANASNPGSGDKLLREAMVLTSQKNIALTADPAFRTFVIEEPIIPTISGSDEAVRRQVFEFKPSRFTFAQPKGGVLSGTLPESGRSIVNAVVRHSPRSPGGMASLAKACCGIPQKDLYNKMYKVTSAEELIEWAIREGTLPPELEKRLAELVRHAERHNVALLADEVISELKTASRRLQNNADPFAEAVKRKVGSSGRGLVSAATGGIDDAAQIALQVGGQSVPEVVSALASTPQHSNKARPSGGKTITRKSISKGATSSFSSFVARQYGVLPDRGNLGSSIPNATSRPSGMKFSKIRLSSRGFGGVILGNEVEATSIESKPMWFEWIELARDNAGLSDNSQILGVFRVFFADGTQAITEPSNRAFAHAAANLVFEGVPGAVAALDTHNGDAVGLVGYAGTKNFHYLEKGIVKRSAEEARTFVVHPSIAGLTLGESAVLVDAIPFTMAEKLEDAFNLYVDTLPNKTSLKTSFRNWLYDSDRSTYKFQDVPLSIKRDDKGVLRLERTIAATDHADWNSELRQTSYITFQKFDRDWNPSDEGDPPFYHFSPILIEVWPNFRHLNDFAGLLAVLRWLKTSDAEFIGEIAEPVSRPVRTTLVADQSGLLYLERPIYEIDLDLAEEVNQVSENFIATLDPQARQVVKEIHEARLKRLHLREALNRYDFNLLVQSYENYEDLMDSQQELRYFQQLGEMAENMNSTETRQVFQQILNVDVSTLPYSDQLSLRNEIRGEVSKKKGSWKHQLDQFRNSKPGSFLNRLEKAEEKAAKASPLSEGKMFVKSHLIGELPEPIATKQRNINTQIKELEAWLAKLEQAMVIVDSGNPDDAFLSQEVANAEERLEISDLTAEINRLQDYISDPDTGWFSARWEEWTLSGLKEDREALLNKVRATGLPRYKKNLSGQIEKLTRNIQEKQSEAKASLESAVEKLDFPGFEAWWALQNSFREQVHQPVAKVFAEM